MRTGNVMLAALCCACAVVSVCGQSWSTTVYEEGGNVTLDCYSEINDTGIDYSVYGWMFPDLTVVNTSYNDGRRWVSEEYYFTITQITNADFGQYHCMLQNMSGEWDLVTLGLNLEGPFFQDLWEMYKMNTIVGCSAFGGFLLIVLIFWLLWHFRWQAPKPELEEKAGSLNGKRVNGDLSFYENLGYVPVVDEVGEIATIKVKHERDDDVILRSNVAIRSEVISTQL